MGEQAGLGAVGAAQPVQHPRDVALDPGFGQVQPGRDLRVGQALTEAGQHLGLAVGERPGQAGVEDLIYLDATPRQGEETLPGWAAFRVAHLRDDNTTSATVDAHAENLPFLGATGSCVLDDYVTRVGAHHYREIACLVQGVHGASVLVAATPAADWNTYQALLEQAVAVYSLS